MCDPFIGGRLTKRKGCLLPPSWLDHHERKPFLDSHTFPLEPFNPAVLFLWYIRRALFRDPLCPFGTHMLFKKTHFTGFISTPVFVSN